MLLIEVTLSMPESSAMAHCSASVHGSYVELAPKKKELQPPLNGETSSKDFVRWLLGLCSIPWLKLLHKLHWEGQTGFAACIAQLTQLPNLCLWHKLNLPYLAISVFSVFNTLLNSDFFY